jgi:TctA family transporter
MAVFIGGVALLGSGDLEVGPQMLSPEKLDITYTVVWSLALANVVGAGLCIALSSSIARLTTIRFVLLAPFLFMLIAFAAFQSAQSLGDLVLRIQARLSWPMAGLYAICGIAFMCFMAAMLNRDFPAGQLQNYLQLPWPLG